jgi:hypothetical protein
VLSNANAHIASWIDRGPGDTCVSGSGRLLVDRRASGRLGVVDLLG